MDWKRYWNELINSIGAASFVLLFIQLGSGFTLNFEIVLLKAYIVMALFVFLNYHLFPKIIKNFRERRKLFYAAVVIDATILWTLTEIIFSLINMQETKINNILFITLPILFVFFTTAYLIVYFAENARIKRMNKKLDEYKQKNDDDKTDK